MTMCLFENLVADLPEQFDVLVRILHITDDASFRSSFEFDAQFFGYDHMREVAEEFWRRVQGTLS